MSNKILIIVIIIILALAVGIVFIVRSQNKSMNVTQNEPVKENSQTNPTPSPAVTTSTPETVAEVKPEILNGCQRMFDENKLKNAKVDLVNRQVEINVKKFGKIKLAFYEKDAPKTVENFLRLTNAGYFDCITFHRVSHGFVIQGGDPTGTGSGGLSAFGATFADELNPETPSYKTGYVKGTLAMANRGPNTNSSQFFIILEDANDKLSKDYTIFGKVIAGQDVVDKIGKVEVTPGPFGPTDGAPKVPVVMETVRIIK